MGAEPPSNMGFFEKIRKYPLYYLYKFLLYAIIIIIIYFIEKFLFKCINLFFYFWFISVIIQIILNLWFLRFVVLKVEFPALSFILSRIVQNRVGKREAVFLYNELESLNSALDLIFDKSKPVEELKHLSTIQKNVKSSNVIIKHYYKIFTKMKIKFNKFTIDQNIFYQNLTNLYNSFEQSEFIKLLNNMVKQLRTEKKFLLKDLSIKEKEKINNEKIETQKYIESIKISLDLLINQIRDYLGENYYICKPRYIRNFFNNYLFASIHQFHVELDNYFIYEEKKLKTKDRNIIDYIIINNNTGKDNDNYDKKLMIICGPNGEPYQVFSRNIALNKYLTKGIDVLCWNYRGYGFSTGKATFDNLKSDVIEIYEEIQKLKKYKKIGVHGISIGGVPCCYLANQKKEVCLLVSDRNFGQIEYIVRHYSIGKYLEFLYKFLFIPSSRTVDYYIENDAHKIILNDPNDDIVTEEGSLKTLLSEEFCKRHLELNLNGSFISISNNNINDNSIELETLDETNASMLSNTSKIKNNTKDNLLNDIIISPSVKNDKTQEIKNKSALDILLSDNKNTFIECLINITEALKDEKLNYKKNSLYDIILKLFNKSKNEDNYSQLKEEELQNSANLCDFIRTKMNSCLEKIKSGGDNLSKLITKKTKYQQQLFIENFFNNLFIWGTFDKRDDYGCVYHSTEYIDIMLSKVISMLNLFLNSQEIAPYKKNNIIKNIENFYNYLIKIKNNMRFLGIRTKNGFVSLSDDNNYEKELIKLGRGNLVWLNCGHNGLLFSEENMVLKHYLKESDLFKKEKNEIIRNDNNDDNFGDENIFCEDLDSSISNLN